MVDLKNIGEDIKEKFDDLTGDDKQKSKSHRGKGTKGGRQKSSGRSSKSRSK